MEAIQTNYGKAFEYSCLKVLEANISKHRPVAIIASSSLTAAKTNWEEAPVALQVTMDKAALAGIKTLFIMEPRIVEDGKDTLELAIQPDSQGQAGDVRDVLLIRKSIDWEIGLSVKHNHTAVKHSRLSMTIDFGKDWFSIPCSPSYFESIKPLFGSLKSYKENGKKWSELKDKEERFYIPLLNAFRAELMRLDAENPGIVTSRLLEYLLGRNDFYKLISQDDKQITMLQCFNLHGTLSAPAINEKARLRGPKLNLPSKIYNFDFKRNKSGLSRTTLELVMDENWVVTFRIHNASTLVEESLKFDVNLTGLPSGLFVQHAQW
jgi:hypothetical protein